MMYSVEYPAKERIPIFWVMAGDESQAMLKARQVTAMPGTIPPVISADNNYSVKLDRDSGS